MSADKILTDDQVAIICQQFDLYQDMSLARAIEQAVLQSEQVQAWKRDAERYRAWRDCRVVGDPQLEERYLNELPDACHRQERYPTEDEIDAAFDAAMEQQT